jgi:hypothetical protein
MKNKTIQNASLTPLTQVSGSIQANRKNIVQRCQTEHDFQKMNYLAKIADPQSYTCMFSCDIYRFFMHPEYRMDLRDGQPPKCKF